MSKTGLLTFNRPQQLALLLLMMLCAQSLWVIHRQTLTERDFDFARCGREMWEKPSPLAGYFTTCGNIQDGTLGYRIAGLPLTIQRVVAGQSEDSSTWEMRHELSYVLLLLHGAFLLVGLALGAALWWVTRRLYGNTGGFIALALYCFAPPVIHACTYPNNEILAAFGLFAAVYTAVGVAHSLQGPRGKGRTRLLLLILALGFTAAAHVAAFMIAVILALIFMGYVAEGRRAAVAPIVALGVGGALVLVFASYAFNSDAYSYFFRSGAGFMWLSTRAARIWVMDPRHAAMVIAVVAALFFYIFHRRSRYFGNTMPLLIAGLLFFLMTTGISSEPTLWALPFLLAFVAGVFADVLESRYRRVFLWATGSILLLQVALSIVSLPRLG